MFLIIFSTFILAQKLDQSQRQDALNAYFQNLTQTPNAESMGFTYFTANRTGSTSYNATFTSFYHGTCYPLNENSHPASSSSLWRIGSGTKVFISTAIFQLIEAGKLSLTDHASKYLPEVDNLLKSSPSGKEPTILDYLQHTVGLEDRVFGMLSNNLNATEIEVSVYKRLFPAYMDTPGEVIAYSNAGVLVLGALVEKISEKKLIDYIRDMLAPIYQEQGVKFDEKNVGFTSDIYGAGSIKDICVGQKSYEPFGVSAKAPGDLIARPIDLARFMAAHLMNSTAIYKKSETTELSRTFEGNGKIFQGGFAKMWEVVNFKGVQIITKGGNIPGYNSMLWFIPELNEGGAISFAGSASPKISDIYNLFTALHPELLSQPSLRAKYKQLTNDDKLKTAVSKIPSVFLQRRVALTGLTKIFGLLGITGTLSTVAPSTDPKYTINVRAFGQYTNYIAVEVPGLPETILSFANPDADNAFAPFLTVKYSGPVFSSNSVVQNIVIGEFTTAFPVSTLDGALTIEILLGFEVLSMLIALGLGVTAVIEIYKHRGKPDYSNVATDMEVEIPEKKPTLRNFSNEFIIIRRLNLAAIALSVLVLTNVTIIAIIAASIFNYLFFGNTAAFIALETFLIVYTVESVLFVLATVWLATRIRFNRVWLGFVGLFGASVVLGTVILVQQNLFSFRFW
ncbi:hypothetical protein HK098_003132 [Nowakowskiella sp. JEL0407]|nr:hypothetical protein HK098_003132 [Nowakowskiella sp. JEL0407]